MEDMLKDKIVGIDDDVKEMIDLVVQLPREERAIVLAGMKALKIRLDLERGGK